MSFASNKKLWSCILGVVSLCFICFISVPDFETSSGVVDIGSLQPGTYKTVSLGIKNLGLLPLKIQDITVTCSCTSASLTPSIISKGSEGRLDVVVKAGLMTKTIQEKVIVFTNEIWGRQHIFEIVGIVDSFYDVVPKRIPIGTILPTDHPLTTYVDLIPTLGKKLDPNIYIESTSSHVAGEIEINDTLGSARLTATLLPNAPSGVLSEYIKVAVGRDNPTYFQIPFSGKIKSDIFGSPETLFFILDDSNSLTKKLEVSLGGKYVLDDISFKIKPDNAEKNVFVSFDYDKKIQVTVAGLKSHQNFEAALVLTSKHSNVALLNVPILAVKLK